MKTVTKSRLRDVSVIILSLYLIVSASVVTVNGLTVPPPSEGINYSMTGVEYYFRAFTNVSNCFVAVLSAGALIVSAGSVISGKIRRVPRALTALLFCGNSATMLTFFTVLFFLSPGVARYDSFFTLYRGYLLFFHFINPLVSLAVFLLVRTGKTPRPGCFIAGSVPAALYGIVYTLETFVFKRWDDFYNFTHGGNAAWAIISAVIIMLLSLMISFALLSVRIRISKAEA